MFKQFGQRRSQGGGGKGAVAPPLTDSGGGGATKMQKGFLFLKKNVPNLINRIYPLLKLYEGITIFI